MKTRVEIFARGDDLIGEGPWWSHEEQVLYWIDIGRKALHCRTLEGKATVWTLSIRPGCVAGVEGGDLALAGGAGLYRFDITSGATTLMHSIPLPAGVRFNEGKPDTRGRLWVGSMQDNFGPDDKDIRVER